MRHSMTPESEYGDKTCRLGSSWQYELNAVKYMYGGYLDDSEIDDFRKEGRQICQNRYLPIMRMAQ